MPDPSPHNPMEPFRLPANVAGWSKRTPNLRPDTQGGCGGAGTHHRHLAAAVAQAGYRLSDEPRSRATSPPPWPPAGRKDEAESRSARNGRHSGHQDPSTTRLRNAYRLDKNQKRP